jgi:hypothetical protein
MLLSRCIEVVASSRPSANYVVESLKDILSSVGGDPRRKVNSEDRNYLRQIENMAMELSESKIYAKHEERKPKEQITAAPVSAVALASSTGTATTVSAISDVSAALSNEKSLSSSPSKQLTAAIPLESLNSEESIELLISLGLSANIRNRVKELNIIIDGGCLQFFNDVETFQELEGGTISNLRLAGLKSSLAKLKKLQEAGISLELLNELKKRITDEEKKRIDEETQLLEMKRAEEARKLIVEEREKKEKLAKQKLEEQEKQKENERKKAAEVPVRAEKDERAERSLPLREDRNGKEDEAVKPPNDLPRVSSDSHSDDINSFSWDFVGNKIASGSFDKTIKIWDGKSLKLFKTLEGHSDQVLSVAWNHDGTKLVSGSKDKTVKVWDGLSGQILATLEGHGNLVFSVAWNHDGSWIASGSGNIKIWDGRTLKLERTLICVGICLSLSWSHDGSKLVSGSWDGTIQIWDSSTGTLLKTLIGHSDSVKSVSWSHDDKKVVSGSYDKTVRIWNSITGDLMKTLEGHSKGVCCVAFSHDDRMIASPGEKKLIIWDAFTGQALNTYELAQKPFGLAWSSDDSKIVVDEGYGLKLLNPFQKVLP